MGEKSEADVMEITGDDAAFILGSGGKTKAKLAQVSGANLYIVEKGTKVRCCGGAPAGSSERRCRGRCRRPSWCRDGPIINVIIPADYDIYSTTIPVSIATNHIIMPIGDSITPIINI